MTLTLDRCGDLESPGDLLAEFLAEVENRRVAVSRTLHETTRANHGQIFTPMPAAQLIASLVRLPQGHIRVLDPGAGIGSLTAALTARLIREVPDVEIELVAIEVDRTVADALRLTLDECIAVGREHGCHISTTLLHDDLVDLTTGFRRHTDPLGEFDIVIMNPPYRKLRKSERAALAAEGADAPNLYAVFLAVGANVLHPGGQLVAITPRSFANGAYFRPFRRSFLCTMALNKLHLFGSRSSVFADGGVLQENVIFSATKGGAREQVVLTHSHDVHDPVTARTVTYAEVVRPRDADMFIRIPATEDDAADAGVMELLPCKLADLGLGVSTGPVVDFRAVEYLLPEPTEKSIPLIYPANLRNGLVEWPRLECGKDQALATEPGTVKLLLPNARYVLVKRFSSKEERRRVVAAVYEPAGTPCDQVGIENHINYFHANRRGLDRDFAYGLSLWLNSTLVDQHFRTFSGHTQVNAGDLTALRYPARDQLVSLGRASERSVLPDQETIDTLVRKHVSEARR